MLKLKLKNAKIKPDYKCPLSGIFMNKPCFVSACHANIGGCHKTNCLYQFYPNKTDFDKFDLMFATNNNEKKLKELFAYGKTKSYETGILFSILTRLRDNNTAMHCANCGVLRTTKGTCLNVVECQYRQVVQNEIINTSKLKYPEFKTKNSDVFLLLQNKAKINELTKNLNLEKEWYDIIGLKKENANKYNLVRSLV